MPIKLDPHPHKQLKYIVCAHAFDSMYMWCGGGGSVSAHAHECAHMSMYTCVCMHMCACMHIRAHILENHVNFL